MLNTKIVPRVLMQCKCSHANKLALFGRQMRAACDTQSIHMPWARRHHCDQPYSVASAEIAARVKVRP